MKRKTIINSECNQNALFSLENKVENTLECLMESHQYRTIWEWVLYDKVEKN